MNPKAKAGVRNRRAAWASDLIGTQREAYGFKFPKILANKTMGTRNQASSSCIDCHQVATTSCGNKPADFGLMMGMVQKPTGK